MRLIALLACACAAGCNSSSESELAGADARIIDESPDAGSGDGGANPTDLPRCEVPGLAIVTDIDATLTTSDTEFLTQLLTGAHEPAERPGAADLINAYADRGYYIVYLTSRPEGAPVGLSGETTTDATLRWLTEHGYPVAPDHTRLTLAPGLVFGASSADYKGGALVDMETEGFQFAYAYGNATSDIDAYATAGVPTARTFIIGPEGGVGDTVAVEGEGWTDHIASFVDELPPACRWQ